MTAGDWQCGIQNMDAAIARLKVMQPMINDQGNMMNLLWPSGSRDRPGPGSHKPVASRLRVKKGSPISPRQQGRKNFRASSRTPSRLCPAGDGPWLMLVGSRSVASCAF